MLCFEFKDGPRNALRRHGCVSALTMMSSRPYPAGWLLFEQTYSQPVRIQMPPDSPWHDNHPGGPVDPVKRASTPTTPKPSSHKYGLEGRVGFGVSPHAVEGEPTLNELNAIAGIPACPQTFRRAAPAPSAMDRPAAHRREAFAN